ncbi:MAG: nicotinate-nucleotide adenylyltransferase [Aeriscardovia sp.]|nr:nicotinate-nucleotide adenylyltransferase [Aeriscardovia sp.]MBQ5521012.1 nicotinate-nucleotide adenylyltransferase [Aeriscardovia sp.]
MKRIGIMGGSFDPIHYGHLAAASQAAFSLGLDRVVFAPTNFSLNKRPKAGARDRCAMAAMATAPDPRFSVSKVDVERGGPTFAFDTVSDLSALLGPCELFFITGMDALAGMEGWKNWENLLSMARFVGATRPGCSTRLPEKLEGRAIVLPVPSLAISSTEIRRRVGRGEPIDYLTSPSVCRFIRFRGLYGAEFVHRVN